MENKEQSKCCEKCFPHENRKGLHCPCCPCHQSTHQEPVSTQKEDFRPTPPECRVCGYNHEPDCDTKLTQEPMEWEILFRCKYQHLGIGVMEDLVRIIKSQIKQAEEREQERIVKEIERCIPKFDFDNSTHDKENQIAYYTHNKVLDEVNQIITNQ